MTLRRWFVLTVLLTFGCASSGKSPSTLPSEFWRKVPQASSRSGFAHICPYSPNLAYTAAHVITDVRGSTVWFLPLTWQQDRTSGSFFPLYSDIRRDLAIGCTDEGFPRWFERATEPPKVGDTLNLPAYRWLEGGLPRYRAEVKVADVMGGVIRLDARPMSASSGACLLNEDGLLVGIYHWSAGIRTSFAASVWGEWGEIPAHWRDRETYGWARAGDAAAQGCASEWVK